MQNIETIRSVCELRGAVQGVGFRPALFRLARAAGLGGMVQNRSGSVRLTLAGPADRVDAFLRDLPAHLPPPARIDSWREVERGAILPEDVQPFAIETSAAGAGTDIVIPADLRICPACRRELFDPADRRHGYPFTTCTACGPRYTVVTAMPYDRERTTLSVFPLCPDCAREYGDPADRRFHAESVACPRCGPQLSLLDMEGRRVNGDPLRRARALLAEGNIIAVRGLGGFQLAADATRRAAVMALRERKHRPHKPLAVVADSLAGLQKYARVSAAETELLSSSCGPIMVLDLHPERPAGAPAFDLLTPDGDSLGAMLPTTPLHELLLHPLPGDPTPGFEMLVMTSGNRRGEPICLADREALGRLRGIADYILTHNRDIRLRNDDSVAIVQNGQPQVWRRSRGYAPEPLPVPDPLQACVLSFGAEMKNAIALGFDRQVVLSPHIGDLETPEAVNHLDAVVEALPRFLDRVPERIAVDAHPDLFATVAGRAYAKRWHLPVFAIQHHHAHGLAALAEHGWTEGLALVFDGNGLGDDGHTWGAELLGIQGPEYRRLATFAPVPLPGGDAAVLQPARQLWARWVAAGVRPADGWAQRLGITPAEADLWAEQIFKGINTPQTHAAGRVFDAFAVWLGLCPGRITYDGQPAIRLEALAARADARTVSLPGGLRVTEQNGLLAVDWREFFASLAASPPPADRAMQARWARAFHALVAEAAERMIVHGVAPTRGQTVALSGGVFMNRILTRLLCRRLEAAGLKVLLHQRTPPNDGCVAFGQALACGLRK